MTRLWAGGRRADSRDIRMIPESSPATQRIALVTGATSGIGLAAAQALARLGFGVVIVSRNAAKCERVAGELARETGGRADWLAGDLAVMADVRRLAAEFRRRHDRLDLLLNNAGISPSRRLETAEGLERAFAVNHLGHFLLTHELLELVRGSAPARVVNVSSNIYKQARLEFDNLQLRRRFSAMTAYANSKLANLLFTFELSRRLAGSGVTVNAMTPGMVRTNIGTDGGWFLAFAKRLADRLLRAKSPEEGADTLVWLATAPEVEGMSGRYFQDRRELELAPKAADPEMARRLWEASEVLTGIVPDGGT